MKEIIAKSKNGHTVSIDHDNTHIGLHMAETPNLVELVREAIGRTVLDGAHMAFQYDTNQVIGETTLVTTDNTDQIFYAKRKQRETYMRFVKNKSAQPTNIVSVVLDEDQTQSGAYLLWTAWLGPLVPTTPGSPKEMPTSKEFWLHHALVEDKRIIDETTITDACPW